MLINVRPLIDNKQFRLLFLGQTISFFGSMMTYVAIPYQVFELTKSSFLVGLLGFVQLVPLVLAGLYGGAIADSMDRRKVLLYSEVLLILCALGFLINSLIPAPSVILLFTISGLSSVFVGFHRPAMEALTPQIVSKKDFAAVAALGSLRYSFGAVAGPAFAGWLIANYGAAWTYGIDALTYFASFTSLALMKSVILEKTESKANWESIKQGFKYAVSQPVLVGSYLVDIIAMVFAMPIALFPAMGEAWGGAKAVGWLYPAIPAGTVLISLGSGLLNKNNRQGAGVILSAAIWGLFIIALAFAPTLEAAVMCLALAGAADAVSAIYRQTIWNEIIPENYRGRLAGLNMLSYMVGPLLGNARAGFVASISSNFMSIFSGGVLCSAACLGCIWIFPKFWAYRSETKPA